MPSIVLSNADAAGRAVTAVVSAIMFFVEVKFMLVIGLLTAAKEKRQAGIITALSLVDKCI